MEGLECPVCLTTFNRPVTTPCGHTFCRRCWIQVERNTTETTTRKCPVCRAEVAGKLSVNRVLVQILEHLNKKPMVGDADDDDDCMIVDVSPGTSPSTSIPTPTSTPTPTPVVAAASLRDEEPLSINLAEVQVEGRAGYSKFSYEALRAKHGVTAELSCSILWFDRRCLFELRMPDDTWKITLSSSNWRGLEVFSRAARSPVSTLAVYVIPGECCKFIDVETGRVLVYTSLPDGQTIFNIRTHPLISTAALQLRAPERIHLPSQKGIKETLHFPIPESSQPLTMFPNSSSVEWDSPVLRCTRCLFHSPRDLPPHMAVQTTTHKKIFALIQTGLQTAWVLGFEHSPMAVLHADGILRSSTHHKTAFFCHTTRPYIGMTVAMYADVERNIVRMWQWAPSEGQPQLFFQAPFYLGTAYTRLKLGFNSNCNRGALNVMMIRCE
ncbi:protein ORF41 [Cyprinid herpesvirus 1]|uniref:Protein ORF41 n=1 Tax=Cyprinid herpesvirus 1 TaxID=317858 RepID=K7PC59_9VIRU|nr:protein ORF41 [Cyprinid herpesvirus 1]AFJ20342.1 protein ORF41 [Cyprinid herpesvirus 1]